MAVSLAGVSSPSHELLWERSSAETVLSPFERLKAGTETSFHQHYLHFGKPHPLHEAAKALRKRFLPIQHFQKSALFVKVQGQTTRMRHHVENGEGYGSLKVLSCNAGPEKTLML